MLKILAVIIWILAFTSASGRTKLPPGKTNLKYQENPFEDEEYLEMKFEDLQIRRQRQEQSLIGIAEEWNPREYFKKIMDGTPPDDSTPSDSKEDYSFKIKLTNGDE